MFIEIRGVQFVNKGAYLMLLACLEQIHQLWPEAKVVLAPNANSPYANRIAVGAWQKLSFRMRGVDVNQLAYWLPQRLRRLLTNQFGLVMEPDIALVLDASGFSYGDQWGGRAVRVLAAEIRRLAKHKKGYILLPQAFGPFSKKADQVALSKALPAALLVCPRDDVSAAALRQLSTAASIQQFADFTNLVAAMPPTAAEQPAGPYAVIIPNSAMLSKRNQNNLWHQQYIPFLQRAISVCLAKGLQPVLLNHEGPVDLEICRQLQQHFPAVPLVSPEQPQLVKGWIAGAELVISSRFHGCVSALSAGVPCVATSWSHKYEMLFAEYQQSDAVVSADICERTLHELFTQLRSPANRQQIALKADLWQQQSHLLWQTVASVVQSALSSGRVNI